MHSSNASVRCRTVKKNRVLRGVGVLVTIYIHMYVMGGVAGKINANRFVVITEDILSVVEWNGIPFHVQTIEAFRVYHVTRGNASYYVIWKVTCLPTRGRSGS